MKMLMTIAAGVALGYFAVQFFLKNRNGENAEASEPKQRLHRSVSNRKIAGVCGGIAEYFNVDPSIIRIAMVVLFFGWGSGLLAYIVCALVLPEE